MLVLSNRRLGPSLEILVSDGIAASMLRATAEAARPFAAARWEHELVRWLDERASDVLRQSSDRPATANGSVPDARATAADKRLDVGDIAWTPDHFEAQRRFLVAALLRAEAGSEHAVLVSRWRGLVEAHPADSVQVGRRWTWQPTA